MTDAFARDDGEDREDDIMLRNPAYSEPIPDLSRVPEERWREVLRPLSPMGRIRAQGTVTPRRTRDVAVIIGELIVEEPDPRMRVLPACDVRLPRGDPPPAGARRQVNFRLGTDEPARLVAAAQLYGMRPNVLARILTKRGVDRALREERRDE